MKLFNHMLCICYTVTYMNIPVHTSTYLLIHACTCTYYFILLHTGTYQYIPVHIISYLTWSRFKKDTNGFRTRDLLHTMRMHYHCTERVQTPNTGYRAEQMFVSISELCKFLPVYLALDVGSPAPVPLRHRLRPWRPPPGSGLESHDSPSQHCNMSNVPVDGSATEK